MSILATPALPLHTAGKYVAAAYIVFFTLVLIYVAIMAMRQHRIERDLGELLERFPAAPPEPGLGPEEVEGGAGDQTESVPRAESAPHQESARV